MNGSTEGNGVGGGGRVGLTAHRPVCGWCGKAFQPGERRVWFAKELYHRELCLSEIRSHYGDDVPETPTGGPLRHASIHPDRREP